MCWVTNIGKCVTLSYLRSPMFIQWIEEIKFISQLAQYCIGVLIVLDPVFTIIPKSVVEVIRMSSDILLYRSYQMSLTCHPVKIALLDFVHVGPFLFSFVGMPAMQDCGSTNKFFVIFVSKYLQIVECTVTKSYVKR